MLALETDTCRRRVQTTMNAQVQINGRGPRSTAKSNSLYTPTCTASDREEEVESSGPDLSDYYSDSGYPTRPRPRHILWTSRRPPLPTGTAVAENGLQRRASTATKRPAVEHSHPRSRRLSAPTVPAAREVKSKAFSKLRSLKNNRVIPVQSPDRQRPPSSLATTCLSANGTHVTSPPPANGQPKQLRSFSLPSGSASDAEDMAQAKLKKAKKVGRALSFSFGSGDKKKRARSIFGTLGRNGGRETLAVSEPPQVSHSPVLMGRKRAGDETIYEEDKASLSSAEEQEDRLGSLSYLHGCRFGSCRELTRAGLEEEEAGQPLRPLSSSRHKRPSLPSFQKLPSSRQESAPANLPQSLSYSRGTEETSTEQGVPSPPPSPASSPSRGRLRRRKLSDPGSAPSTPEVGNSPTAERRVSREEGGGLARSSRPIRKGFTFSVGGANLSPDWVSQGWGVSVAC